MSNFTARTRLRGEITYYHANWIDDYYGKGKRGVMFMEGPHHGNAYPENMCAIARDDSYLLGKK